MNDEINIVLGTGGSGETKRVPAKIFIEVMKYALKKGKCKFFIATGNAKEEIEILNQITQSDLKEFCIPLNLLPSGIKPHVMALLIFGVIFAPAP